MSHPHRYLSLLIMAADCPPLASRKNFFSVPRFVRLACFTAFFVITVSSAGQKTTDPSEIVKKALVNYKLRELQAGQYACIENDSITLTHRGHSRGTDTYELIPLEKGVYRRHRLHNGRPLPPEEEKTEQQQFEQRMQDAKKTLDRIANDQSVVEAAVLLVDRPLQFWRLDLEPLTHDFSFTWLGKETFNGHRINQLQTIIRPRFLRTAA
jgi:hypothetical protein